MFIYFDYGNFLIFFGGGGWLEIRSRKSKLQNEQIQSIFPFFFRKNQLKEMALEKRCICCIALMYEHLIGLGQTVQSILL